MKTSKTQIEFNDVEGINYKKYFTLFYKNVPFFIISLFLCLFIAFLINRYSSNIYSTSATIIINDQSQYPSGADAIIKQFSNIKTTGKNIETEIGILHSFYIAKKTIEELDFAISYYVEGRIKDVELYHDSPIKVILDTTHKQSYDRRINITIIDSSQIEISTPEPKKITKRIKFGSWFVTQKYAFKVEKDTAFQSADLTKKYCFKINNLDKLAEYYQAKLSVELMNEDASIINLSISGNIVEKNIAYLNKLANVYIQKGMDDKNQVSINTANFIDGLLGKIVDSLQIAEKDLQSFRQNNRIVDLTKEGSAFFDKLEEQQNQKSVIEIRMKYYEYLLKYIEKRKDFKDVITPSIMGINDQLLNQLVSELSGLYQEKKVVEYSVKSNNPQVDVINVRIKNTVESLIEVVTNIIQGAKIERDEVNKKIAELDTEIKKLPVTEREMIKIKRKFDLNDNICTFLQQKRAEAGITSASNTPDAKLLDKASVLSSNQNAPNKKRNYVFAFILGLIMPGLTIVLRVITNNRINDLNDLEKQLNLPILAHITHNSQQRELVVKEKPKSIISESFRSARTNLKYLLAEKESVVISITSTMSGEGKTFMSINLASILALSNKKVVLLGLDLRKPKLHNSFSVPNTKGISTYLIGQNSLNDITTKTEIPNVDLLVSGPIPPNPSELLETTKMQELIQELRKNYDYIILDTPPVALVSDATVLDTHSDCNLFVIRFNYSNKAAIPYVNSLYAEKKLKNLCVVVNDVDLTSKLSYGSNSLGRYGDYYRNNKGSNYYDDEQLPNKNLVSKMKDYFRFN